MLFTPFKYILANFISYSYPHSCTYAKFSSRNLDAIPGIKVCIVMLSKAFSF